MKRLVYAAALLAFAVIPASAQKQRYSESHKPDPLLWPLTIHVTHARITGVSPNSILHLDGVVDGKHVELETSASGLLHTGDYQARVVTSDEKKSGWFSRSYELLFTDGTHVVFTEVAESE